MHTHLRRIAFSTLTAIAAIASFARISYSGIQNFSTFKTRAECEAQIQALRLANPRFRYWCVPVSGRQEPNQRNGVKGKAPSVLINSPKTPITSRRLRDKFMKKQLDTILANPNHPLKFLVDYSKRNWKSRKLYSKEIGVQAGHTQSRWSLDPRQPETVALEDVYDNHMDSRITESRRGFINMSVIEIGGVPVIRNSARTWESMGLLPRGTVQNAPDHPGYSAYTRR